MVLGEIMDFEKRLVRLEEIVHKMEKGELGLEESLKLFEEGVRMTRECQGQLAEAEAKVKKLIAFEENGTPKLENFETNKS